MLLTPIPSPLRWRGVLSVAKRGEDQEISEYNPSMSDIEPLHLTHQPIKKILFARNLRKEMTETEQKLWTNLRGRKLGCKYQRQVPLGMFIADFCCMQHRLIIEIDGKIHKRTKEYDRERDQLLQKARFRILRFTNDGVHNDIKSVIEKICHACCSSLPSPLHRSGEGCPERERRTG